MRSVIALIVAVVGILLGIYLGAWVCFVGGIVQVIEGIKADPVSALDIAIGALRFFSASIVGWLTVVFGVGMASAIAKD